MRNRPRRSLVDAALQASLIVPLALIGVGGCVSTRLTASEAHVPIVLGPIRCIGCVARAPDRSATTWHRARADARAFWVAIPGLSGYSSEKVVPFDRLLPAHPCTEDFSLSSLRVRAWVLDIPPISSTSDVSVDAEVTRSVVPGGSCLPPPPAAPGVQ